MRKTLPKLLVLIGFFLAIAGCTSPVDTERLDPSSPKSPKKETEADNRITAKRYSIFFRSLYNATYLDQEHSELFLEILKQAPRDLLGNGIPKEIPFVHKTGVRIDEAVRADSGIVYAHGRPYIITVMIQKKKGALDEKEVGLMFEDISRKIHHYVTRDN